MIAYNFHTIGKGAGSSAEDGRWEWAHPLQVPAGAKIAFRAAYARSGEQRLIDRLVATLGHAYSREQIVTFYVALKTSPLMILTAPAGSGKARFVEYFAATLFGAGSGQLITIGSSSWAQQSGEHHYYRDMHARFGVFNLLETLREAETPENAGRVFLIRLKDLSPVELDRYLDELRRVGPEGRAARSRPGAAGLPLPANTFIISTLHLPLEASAREHRFLDAAVRLELTPPPQPLPPVEELDREPPLVGLQRAMLAGTIHDEVTARMRLEELLGAHCLANLRPSLPYLRKLRREQRRNLRTLPPDVIQFVANSFSADGVGLFDAADRQRNARHACDAYLLYN